jgi:hypothetical protein
MGTKALTVVEKIPAIDNPVTMKSLPASIEFAIASVCHDDLQKGPTGRYRECVTLPRELMPSPAAVREIENCLLTCGRFVDQTPQSSPEAADELLGLIERLCLALPSQVRGERGIEAATEAYVTTLRDIPIWAIKRAIELWYKGEAHADGDEFNYTFRPGFADLRKIANRVAWPMRRRIHELSTLLKAEPRREITPEEKADVIARFDKLTGRLRRVARQPDPRARKPGHAARVIREIAAKSRRRQAGLIAHA